MTMGPRCFGKSNGVNYIMKGMEIGKGSIFELEGIPAFRQVLPLALQHVVAMIVGCVTPAIIVSGAVSGGGMSQGDKVILIQAALFVSAISTLLQLFPLGSKSGFHIGSSLPAIIVGLLVRKIRVFFPPLITGTVVFTIGLSLYPTAINYMAGGTSSETYGSWQNWAVAIFTLVIVTVLNHFGKGIVKLASILIGMVAGYVVSAFFGMVSFSSASSAALRYLSSRPLQ